MLLVEAHPAGFDDADCECSQQLHESMISDTYWLADNADNAGIIKFTEFERNHSKNIVSYNGVKKSSSSQRREWHAPDIHTGRCATPPAPYAHHQSYTHATGSAAAPPAAQTALCN